MAYKFTGSANMSVEQGARSQAFRPVRARPHPRRPRLTPAAAGAHLLRGRLGMRLYNAICAWLEAHAASMSGEVEPQPEGNNFTQAEHAHSYSAPPELHAASDRQSLDDDQGGVYRIRPIGFQRNI